ncbi:MAG: hypothetical protein A3E88_05215 [Legionellales bacterium RIFCSPHIGHO2_12_FULL_35_11]|nr:MAG: hypothetical protein A3E88_05215 [Legionellales bacterium RIFCSPHIGHO2_12_FULL_35_11]
MSNHLFYINQTDINRLEKKDTDAAVNALESGHVLFLPNYTFSIKKEEKKLLSESILAKNTKNISFNYNNKKVSGMAQAQEIKTMLSNFMSNYALYSNDLIAKLLPEYKDKLIWGRTSFRPAEINGRVSSKRKDDARVHVDAFPSSPVNGKRILRVFCNINPYYEARVWETGEPFPDLMQKFSYKLPKYNSIIASLLNLVGGTKTKRSAYDHYMLKLHDTMKLDEVYQENLYKTKVQFPSNSTWVVFTDQVSHAALSGQFLLEQTFYLAVEDMRNPESSPLAKWESLGVL